MLSVHPSVWIATPLVWLGLLCGTSGTVMASAPLPLPVPFIPQGYCYPWCEVSHWNGHNNCGPASLAMVVDANGGRPTGTDNRRFVSDVRFAMTGAPDACRNPGTTRRQLDHGAAHYGLCPREEAWSLDAIRRMTDRCIPVIAFIDPHRLATLRNRGWYGNLDHILVITGVDDATVHYNDPLDHRGACRPSPCDPNAICGGPSTAPWAMMNDALYYASYGWWGKGYGDPLGDCDVLRCDGTRNGGGGQDRGAQRPTPLDQVRVRMSSRCPDKMVQVFWEADDDYGFSESRSQKHWLIGSQWQELTFDLARSEGFEGRLRKLRIDPAQGHDGCTLGLSYVWLTNRSGDSGELWWFSEVAGPGRGCPLLEWACKGLRDFFLPGAWVVHTTDPDPWIENTRLDIRLD